MCTIGSLTPYPIQTKCWVLTNQNTAKKMGYKRILICASIGMFSLKLMSSITTHMDHLFLGRGGVFFGISSFVYVAMGAAQQRGNAFFSWVRKQQSGGVILGVRSENLL
jgi:hypothetical protein